MSKTLAEWAESRRCICRHPDARECMRLRGGHRRDDDGNIDWLCECACHDRDDRDKGDD